MVEVYKMRIITTNVEMRSLNLLLHSEVIIQDVVLPETIEKTIGVQIFRKFIFIEKILSEVVVQTHMTNIKYANR